MFFQIQNLSLSKFFWYTKLVSILFTNDLPETVHEHHLHLPDGQPELNSQTLRQEHSYNISCPYCGAVCCYADDSSYSFSSTMAQEISETSWANTRIKLHFQVHFGSKKILSKKFCVQQNFYQSKLNLTCHILI